MKSQEEILKKYENKIREAIYQQELKPVYCPIFNNEIQNILYEAIAQTREKIIGEVKNEIRFNEEMENQGEFERGRIDGMERILYILYKLKK